MNPELGKLSQLKHFSWSDIASFAEVDRWMISYRQGGSGDWKAASSGGDGFLMVTVDGKPYWADAIGQIPFAVNKFADEFKANGSAEKALIATVAAGREYGA